MVDLKDILLNLGVCFKEDLKLRNFSFARTGGTLGFAIYPVTTDEMIRVIAALRAGSIAFEVIGNTTNLLFLDSVKYRCFVFTTLINDTIIDGSKFDVACGRNVSDFVRDTAMRGLSGAEGLEGIPGTLGGALVMNAGAYGYNISDKLESVLVLNEDNSSNWLDRSELVFENRHAPTLDGKIILRARFSFPEGNHTVTEKRVRRFHIARHAYQEWVYPNLGSIFVVPSLNINKEINEHSHKNRALTKWLVSTLYAVWYSKPNFLLRRIKPDLNLPVRFLKYLGLPSFNSNLSSATTANTFTNKDCHSVDVLNYMKLLKTDAGPTVRLENEVCQTSIETIVDNKTYDAEIAILKEIHDQ